MLLMARGNPSQPSHPPPPLFVPFLSLASRYYFSVSMVEVTLALLPVHSVGDMPAVCWAVHYGSMLLLPYGDNGRVRKYGQLEVINSDKGREVWRKP